MVENMQNAYYENLNYPFSVWFGSDLSFGAHLHRQIEIFYVLEGEVDIRIDTVLKTVKASGLSIAFPNTVHSYETKTHCRFAILIFDITLAGEYTNLLTHYRCKDSFISPEQMHSDIYYSIEALMQEKATMDIRLVKAFFSIILGRIFEQLVLVEITEVDQIYHPQKILTYITQNFTQPISLEIISKELGISKYTISRIFSQKIGTSFNNYVNSLRIGLAQQLLNAQDMSVTELSFECGFESPRTFNRAFNDFCGVTPSEYKKILKNKM
jgi:AraC-like DNA-binding protein